MSARIDEPGKTFFRAPQHFTGNGHETLLPRFPSRSGFPESSRGLATVAVAARAGVVSAKVPKQILAAAAARLRILLHLLQAAAAQFLQQILLPHGGVRDLRGGLLGLHANLARGQLAGRARLFKFVQDIGELARRQPGFAAQVL